MDAFDAKDLVLPEKFNRYLNYINRENKDTIYVELFEQDAIVIKEGLVEFTDEDLTKYFTTAEDFNMTVFINKRKFTISTRLFTLLEENFELGLGQNIFRLVVEYDF